MVARLDKLEILQKMWDWAKENLTTAEINKLLSATDEKGRTAFHVAAEFCNLEILQKILDLAKGIWLKRT